MASSHPTISACRTVLIVSLGLSTVSLGFDLAYYGLLSLWLIPSAFVVTVIHHIFLYRHLRRHPNRPHKVHGALIYTLILPILAWLGGTACTILMFYIVQLDTEHLTAKEILPLIGGIIALFEAGVLIELWRRCLKMSKASEAPGMVDDIT